VVQLVGFAAKGLECFYAQNTKKNSGGGASVMALISIKRGSPVVSVLEEGLKRSFQGEWDWKVKSMDNNKFVVKFPSHEMLERVLGFEEFTLKGTGLFVSVNKWGAASLAKAKLFSVWVKINGIPDDLVHYKGICEAASPLGVVQEIDTPAMIKFKLARVKVGVRDPSLIPPSTEITTDPYIYDAFCEVEEVVEQGGLLDEDGVIIPGISDSQVMSNSEDSPSKRAKVGDHGKSDAAKEGIFFTKEELDRYIMEETEKRMEQHVLKMEERILASQLQLNM
jgi:hypothetical protein